MNPHTLRYQNLNLAHGIKIELGRLEFAKWKELYRALAIDELCEEVVNDLNLSRRDLAELPDDDHVDARFADLSANGRLLLREVQNVFGTIADAATGYSSVGDPATKKVFEISCFPSAPRSPPGSASSWWSQASSAFLTRFEPNWRTSIANCGAGRRFIIS